MTTATQSQAGRALRDLVRQTAIAGVGRRAAVLHLDTLPAALTRPHHHRLAREAMMSLATRDHAQCFDLPQGRLAIVWRSRSADEVTAPMVALELLLADLPQGLDIKLGQILSLFDLPHQAPWLLDTLAQADAGNDAHLEPGLDVALLTRLEDSLAHANIAQFLRWRPIMNIERAEPTLAWEERTIAWPDLAATLCPGRNPQDGSWLARHLARCLERRVLTAMTGPRELAGNRAFSVDISISTLLSPTFLAFDAALPAGLRSRVVLRLEAADILADAGAFCFARNFAHCRSYRLLLRDALPGLLDPEAAGLDYFERALTPKLQADPQSLPDRACLVLDSVNDFEQLAWARAEGCILVKGLALPNG